MNSPYAATEPGRAEVDSWQGATLLEFGSPWCGFCRAAQPAINRALAEHPAVRHVKIADGSGRPLGRSFKVKLWPTLVFLRNGAEQSRLVRPRDDEPIRDALAAIDQVAPLARD